jgi:hypothetical protein
MNQKEAYALGKRLGHEAGAYLDLEQVTSAAHEVSIPPFNRDDLRETAEYLASDNELGARDYSPWEHYAAEMNDAGDRSEGLWEKYDKGVEVGIAQAARAFMHNNKYEIDEYLNR